MPANTGVNALKPADAVNALRARAALRPGHAVSSISALGEPAAPPTTPSPCHPCEMTGNLGFGAERNRSGRNYVGYTTQKNPLTNEGGTSDHDLDLPVPPGGSLAHLVPCHHRSRRSRPAARAGGGIPRPGAGARAGRALAERAGASQALPAALGLRRLALSKDCHRRA